MSARNVRQNMLWYALPRFFSKGLTVLLLPLYTRLLAPDEMGVAIVALAIGGIVALVIAPGMEGVYLRWMSRPSDGADPRAVGSLVLVHLLLLTAGLCALILFARPMAALLLPGIPAWPFYYVVVATIGVASLSSPMRAAWRARHQADRVAALEIVHAVLSIGVVLLGLLVYRWGAISLLLGDLAAGVCVLPAALTWIARALRNGWYGAAMRETIPLVFAGLPLSLSLWALSAVDRILLQRFAGPAEVGIYGVGYQVAAAVVMLVIILGKEWQPLIFEYAQDRRLKVDELQNLWRTSLSLFLVLGGGIALCAHDVVRWALGPQYLASASVIPWIAVVAVLKVPHTFLIHLALALGQARGLAVGSLLAVAVFIAGNWWLIPKFGAVGAAWAGVAAHAAACGYLASRRWNTFRVDRSLLGWTAVLIGAVALGSAAGEWFATRLLGVLIIGLVIQQGLKYWRFLATIRPAGSES